MAATAMFFIQPSGPRVNAIVIATWFGRADWTSHSENRWTCLWWKPSSFVPDSSVMWWNERASWNSQLLLIYHFLCHYYQMNLQFCRYWLKLDSQLRRLGYDPARSGPRGLGSVFFKSPWSFQWGCSFDKHLLRGCPNLWINDWNPERRKDCPRITWCVANWAGIRTYDWAGASPVHSPRMLSFQVQRNWKD